MATAERMALKRATRRAAGMCSECDSLPVAGHSVCERHLEARRRYMARHKGRRKAARLCYCGQPAARNRDRCDPCLNIESKRQQSYYCSRQAQGKCVRCGKVGPRPGRVLCRFCAARQARQYRAQKRRRQAKRWRGVLWAHIGGHEESSSVVGTAAIR